jgi:hypothetical protein
MRTPTAPDIRWPRQVNQDIRARSTAVRFRWGRGGRARLSVSARPPVITPVERAIEMSPLVLITDASFTMPSVAHRADRLRREYANVGTVPAH